MKDHKLLRNSAVGEIVDIKVLWNFTLHLATRVNEIERIEAGPDKRPSSDPRTWRRYRIEKAVVADRQKAEVLGVVVIIAVPVDDALQRPVPSFEALRLARHKGKQRVLRVALDRDLKVSLELVSDIAGRRMRAFRRLVGGISHIRLDKDGTLLKAEHRPV